MSTKIPRVSCTIGLSREEARQMMVTLEPLRGWRIPRSPGKNSRLILVDDVIEALASYANDGGSLEERIEVANEFDDNSLGILDPMTLMMDDPAAQEPFEAIERRDEVESYMRSLSPSEAEVITVRFGLRTQSPKTVVETARTLGLSVFAVETAEKNALAKMRRVAGVSAPIPSPYRVNHGKAA